MPWEVLSICQGEILAAEKEKIPSNLEHNYMKLQNYNFILHDFSMKGKEIEINEGKQEKIMTKNKTKSRQNWASWHSNSPRAAQE